MERHVLIAQLEMAQRDYQSAANKMAAVKDYNAEFPSATAEAIGLALNVLRPMPKEVAIQMCGSGIEEDYQQVISAHEEAVKLLTGDGTPVHGGEIVGGEYVPAVDGVCPDCLREGCSPGCPSRVSTAVASRAALASDLDPSE